MNNDNKNKMKRIILFLVCYSVTISIDLLSFVMMIKNLELNKKDTNLVKYNILLSFYVLNIVVELYYKYVMVFTQFISMINYRIILSYYIFYLNFLLFSDIFNFGNNVFSLIQSIVFYFVKFLIIVININVCEFIYLRNKVSKETYKYLNV